MNLSVIIPALNEERSIGPTLRSVYRAADHTQTTDVQGAPSRAAPSRAASSPAAARLNLREIIVVDGGSQDDTVSEAKRVEAQRMEAQQAEAPRWETANLTVTTAPRGRARQMNAGAAVAEGDVLLFLHADTTLDSDAFAAMEDALTRGVDAGTFQLQFSPSSPLLRLYAACTSVPWPRLFFGDRGLFVTRAAFDSVGGYPDWPIFEDLEMVDRLHRHTAVQLLPVAVTTSSRRFQAHGTLRQQLLNGWLWLRYLTGTPPRQLADRYSYDTNRQRHT